MNAKTLFTILLVLLVSGCTGDALKLNPTTGTVTLNGEPLVDVRIEFRKADTGGLSFAETDEQGRFELRHTHGRIGAEPGTYHVSVFRKRIEETRTPEVQILMSDRSRIEITVTEQGPNDFNIDIR
jgi:hypothetical protein